MADVLHQRAEALARYVAELSRRVETPEVRDLTALAELAGQVRRALTDVTPQEIAWAAEQADALVAELSALQRTLAILADLKRRPI